MKRLAILIVALAAVAAADKAAAGEYRWSGPYIGANAQYVWDKWNWPGQNPYVAPPAPCGECGPPNQDLSGAMIGVTAGYNLQFSRIVVGVEGDFDFGNIKSAKRDGNYIVETGKIEDFATLRGRLGYAFGHVLVYGTGGVAFENLEYGESCPSPEAAPFGFCHKAGPYNLSESQWNVGWVAGGGVEWAMSETISLKLEGLYADFGDNEYDLGGPLLKKTIANTDTVFKLGVNYHF